MNNIARLVVTQLPRAQSFSRFCIARSWASVENNGIEREQGVMGRQNIDKKAIKKPTLKTWDRKARRSHINHPVPLLEEALTIAPCGLIFLM